MDQDAVFQWIEVVGWMASALTVATYAVNTMMPLRILAIANSLCFAIYGAVLQLWPLLAMEMILLPINIYRFWQLWRLRRRVHHFRDDGRPDFSVVRTYGKAKEFKKGDIVFSRGDSVDRLYFISSGKVHIEEVDVTLTAGDIFGEIAFFTEDAARTATVKCVEDTRVYELDEKRFLRLQFEDPSFGLSVIRLVTKRLLEDKYRVMAEIPPPVEHEARPTA